MAETLKENSIKIFLPLIRQKYKYTCGVAALQSILVYYHLYSDYQKKLIEQLNADSVVGTEPENIVRFAKKQKLKVREHHDMGLSKLKTQINKKHPVICLIQAWGDPDIYIKGFSGHYVVAVGYDNDNFYFVDPALEGIMGFLPNEEFERRWYFSDDVNPPLKQYGIAIWKPGFHYSRRICKIG